MTGRTLLRAPQVEIPQLVERDESWLVPLLAFAAFAFPQGIEQVAASFPKAGGPFLMLLGVMGALAIGSWAWALVYGGVYYMGAKALRGRRGFGSSTRAIGYALFFPSIMGAFAAAIDVYCERVNHGSSPTLFVASLQLLAGGWAVYATWLAIRSWHRFSWPKTLGAWALGTGLALVPLFLFVMLRNA